LFRGLFLIEFRQLFSSRNAQILDEIAETALEEDCAIFSKTEQYRQGSVARKLTCYKCGKVDHVAAKCYVKDKTDVRISKVGFERKGNTCRLRRSRKDDITCYNCEETGHMARECKKPRNPKRGLQMIKTREEGRPPGRRNLVLGLRNERVPVRSLETNAFAWKPT
jgi:ABC-type ATPase with predicted acetyltransferase domain